MAELFTVHNLFTLLMLIFLQAVLGFDNLLYISIESKRVQADQRSMVRKVGVGVAIFLRIALLYVVVKAIAAFQEPFASFDLPGFLSAAINIHSLIILAGGIFIIYTALKELMHMLTIDELGLGVHKQGGRSALQAIIWIVVMNLVFSFDSILSAIALTDLFPIMALAIVISGLMMMLMADQVAVFLEKNRLYQVLGLFILFLVGAMLVSEGGHLAHLVALGHPVEAMAKSTFYFVIIVLVIVDMAQGRYQKKLDLERQLR